MTPKHETAAFSFLGSAVLNLAQYVGSHCPRAERMDDEAVKKHGRDYLDVARELIK